MIESELDTKRFGFKVGRTNGAELKAASLEEFKGQGYKLIFARVDLEDIHLVNSLEDRGFRIKDTQLTFKHQLSSLQSIKRFTSTVDVRQFKTSDTSHLVQIAKDSFNNYGHYFRNSRLDKRKCLEVYTDWAFNICTDRGFADTILIASENDIPVGFLSLRIMEHEGSKYSAGGMLAVNPQNRGQNIGPILLKAGLDWTREMELEWCEHNVLVSNLPVNRAMLKLGFKPFKPVITMHCWLD